MRVGKIEASGSFFLLLACLNYIDRQAVVPLGMLACMLHEAGHCFIISTLGGNVRFIRLTAVGAEIILAKPLSYWQEGLAALAGPATNMLIALIFSSWEVTRLFAGLNLVLGCFNLIPIGRLDGGRALFCALALLMGPECAHRLSEWTDAVFVALLILAGLLLLGAGGNVTLLLVALWLAVQLASGKKRGNRACHAVLKQVK